MAEDPIERRLAAILAADVVGYSRLMEAAEAATLARLRSLMSEVIEPSMAAHRGRIFKTTGDGALVEFASAVDAVESAIEVQTQLAAREAALGEDERIRLRIGISLGDVMVNGSDIFGNGVNVAARLQALAAPGDICISGNVHEHVANAIAVDFDDLGPQQVKNIARPVPTFRVRLEGGSPARQAAPATPSERPAIAVLPFDNMSAEADQGYFADGMVEDIITGLSRIRWLTVIARNSSFAFKGKSVDIREVARQLDVRYVLEGSVRKAGERVRITAQLIEGETGAHLWADRFDGTLADIFDLQDQITASVVAAIEPSVRKAETDRVRHKRPSDLGAYDLYLRALEQACAFTPAGRNAAVAFLDAALRLQPDYAEAHGLAAWCRQQRFLWGGQDPADRTAALDHAAKAAASGTDDATTLAFAAFAIIVLANDLDAAMPMIAHALAHNPSSAIAHNVRSIAEMTRGNAEETMAHAERSLRLSPFDPLRYMPEITLAAAHLLRDNTEAALEHTRRALEANPGFAPAMVTLAMCLVRLGRRDEARAAVARLMEVAPDTRLSNLGMRVMMLTTSLGLDNVRADLRAAGLPE